ncbi:MAG: response regulator transcription factor [Terrimicrobiaceae bacterium]
MKPRSPSPRSSTEPPACTRILLVDDHPMLRDGLQHMIRLEPDLICCGGVDSSEEALGLVTALKPDLVITDITLPGRNGLELIRDILAMFPEMPILVFSMHDELFYAERALKAGARGYLMKEAGGGKVMGAIRVILAGDIAVSPCIAARILNQYAGQAGRCSHSPVEKLTDREFEVYQLIGEGKVTKEIAQQLHLSAKTVAAHRGHIKEKLGLATTQDLSRYAMRWTEALSIGGPNHSE